jgi:hypothetical protein
MTKLAKPERDTSGRFEIKGDEIREVRSIRATSTVWEALESAATAQGISKADLLEQLVEDGILEGYESSESVEDAKAELIEDIEVLIVGLEPDGDNELELSPRDRAPGRRTLQALIDYLS